LTYSRFGNICSGMRIVARNSLTTFAKHHPEAGASLEHWFKTAKTACWGSTQEVQAAFSKAKILNAERVRFEIQGGNHRLIVAFHFRRQIAFVKFIGTHAEYDRIDALTVSLF
jgi:mRNA interferase HigB